MAGPTRGRRIATIILMGYLLFLAGNEIIGHLDPSSTVLRGGRVGMDASHPQEKLATALLAYSIGIVGTVLHLRNQRPILSYGLIGTCYLLLGVRDEVFYVWEGGRPFNKDHLIPWIFLMLSLPLFWASYREYRERQEGLAALEEVE